MFIYISQSMYLYIYVYVYVCVCVLSAGVETFTIKIALVSNETFKQTNKQTSKQTNKETNKQTKGTFKYGNGRPIKAGIVHYMLKIPCHPAGKSGFHVG